MDGNIDITGTATTAINASQDGVHLMSGATVESSGTGNVSITGIAGSTDGGVGVGLRLEGIFSLHESVNTLAADRMLLDPDKVLIDAGTNIVALRPKGAGIGVDLGSATNIGPGVLELSDAELDRISAGTLQIGDSVSGAISVTSNISRSTATKIDLVSAGSIGLVTGSINTAGGDVSLKPGPLASVSVPRSGSDLILGASNTLTFANGSDFSIAINGKAVDAQYDELNLVGKVDLTGVDLVLTGNYSPAIGDVFAIINNDGTDDVIGMFNGLPEGKVFHVPSGAVAGDYVISYHAGSGNDVFITAVSVSPRLGEIVSPPAIDEDAIQQALA